MSDPSCSCLPRLNRYFLVPLVISFFILGSAFSPSRRLSTEMMQFREEIIDYARQFVGIRYRHAGRNPATGFDCSGFTSYILDKFDAALSSSSFYQSMQGIKVPLSNVMPGDLLFFGRRGRIQHVAMVVEHNDDGIICVHSTCSRGVIVENVSTSPYWRSRILFARDVLGRRLVD